MPSVEWVEPAIVWNGRRLPQLAQPRLAEFASDNFLPEFLEAMGATGAQADPGAYLNERLLNADGVPKLYQPLHGRYYLVTGSLVCRQLGLPDKVVDQANGEQVGFVVRREVQGQNGSASQPVEQGWIEEGPQRGWQAVDAAGRLAGEERFPLHPVRACVATRQSLEQFRPVTSCLRERTVYHGYLATGNRKKYLEVAPVSSNPQAYIAEIDAAPNENFRLNEFDSRVIAPWYDLEKRRADPDLQDQIDEVVPQLSLYLILDLGDLLSRTLPDVWMAVTTNTIGAIPSANTAQRALYELLAAVMIGKDDGSISLREALAERADDLGLVYGEGTEPGGVSYDVRGATYDLGSGQVTINSNFLADEDNELRTRLRNALAEDPQPFQMPDEMHRLLAAMVRPERTAAADQTGERFFLRLVYDYNPDCPPLLSARSQFFSLAAFFDSDAPARLVRLELPDISMQDLRKFKRGVGMQMSPTLRRLMSRVSEDTRDGKLGSAAPGWELGMICTFSLHIIFLVAFIVMFIFLILLNIIFWWLPFLKICFPIPRRS